MKTIFAAIMALLAAGCAVTPQLEEQEPLAPNLSQYRAVYAAVDAAADVQEREGYLAASGRLLSEFVGDLGALGKTAAIGRAPQGQRAIEARLSVTDFNYVGSSARILGGILVGHATLAVTMTLTDSATGAVVGKVSAGDTSSHLQGIFGADSERQIEAIAKDLALKLDPVGAPDDVARSAPGPGTAPSSGALRRVRLEELQQLKSSVVPAGSPGPLAAKVDAPGPTLNTVQFFEKTAPSVWGVRALDAQGRTLASGTGVVVAPHRVATPCDLLIKASSVELRRANEVHVATLEHADAERNLCLLSLDDLVAPAAPLGPPDGVKVGERAYAIAFVDKLGANLEQGLVSGVQTVDEGLPPLRVTIPLGAEANGGGVFDEHGRLIGLVTTYAPRDGVPPNVNFVLPAQWIVQAPARAQEQLAMLQSRPPASRGAPGAGLPSPGSRWSYKVHDRGYSGASWDFSIVLTGVSDSTVTETLSAGDRQDPYGFDARSMAFVVRTMRPDSVFELSPYLLAYLPKPTLPLKAPAAYGPGTGVNWHIRIAEVRREAVSLSAGRFDAVRVKVVGELPSMIMGSSNRNKPQRFEYTAWYAPEVGRYVQARHQMFDVYGTLFSDQSVKLVSFHLGSTTGSPDASTPSQTPPSKNGKRHHVRTTRG